MNETTANQVCRVFADLLDLPIDHVTPATSPQTVESWDSLLQLNLVLALEDRFGLMFEPEEIERMLDVASIIQLVEEKVRASAI